MFHENQQIGNYTLIRKLGRGGFGEVWLAERKSKFVTTKVAVKLPHDEQVDHEAIKQEATLWEQASGHPNILPIIDADEYDGQIVIVSEYAPDGSLEQWLKTHGKMPIQKAVETTIQILDGLEFLHSRNIIHRDLKPANILLQGNTPRLADFGISRALRTTVASQSQNISGTFAYMSPEALDGKRSIQTDIWSVGVNLYQFLTGTLPFPNKEPSVLLAAIIMREFAPLPDFIPSELKKIVAKSLDKNSEYRYKTTGEMRTDLRQFLQRNIQLISLLFSTPQPKYPPDLIKPFLINSTHAFTNAKALVEVEEIETFIRPVSQLMKPKPNLSIPFRKGNKWGFSDYNKKLIVPAKYDDVYPFLEGLACVKLNDKYGFIDETGQEVVSPKYEDVFNFSEGLARVKLNDKFGFIDKAGNEIIPLKYDDASSLSEGMIVIYQHNKYGFIDKTGNEVILPKYDDAYPFSEGLAAITVSTNRYGNNNKYGFIDKVGKEVIPLKYESVSSFTEGLARVKVNNKCGFIDEMNEEIISLKYANAYSFSEGLAAVSLYNRFYGFLDKTGKEVISLKYESVSSFSENLALVKINDRYGFIDIIGKQVISPMYEYAHSFIEGVARVKLGGKYGFIGKTGKKVIPIKYESVSPFFNGIACVKLNGIKFYIDEYGRKFYEP